MAAPSNRLVSVTRSAKRRAVDPISSYDPKAGQLRCLPALGEKPTPDLPAWLSKDQTTIQKKPSDHFSRRKEDLAQQRRQRQRRHTQHPHRRGRSA